MLQVEKNDKILYIAFKLQIQKYDVDWTITNASLTRDICFDMYSWELIKYFEVKI